MKLIVIADGYKEPVFTETNRRKIKDEINYLINTIALYEITGTSNNTIVLKSAMAPGSTRLIFTDTPAKYINQLTEEMALYKASKGYKINGKWVK